MRSGSARLFRIAREAITGTGEPIFISSTEILDRRRILLVLLELVMREVYGLWLML